MTIVDVLQNDRTLVSLVVFLVLSVPFGVLLMVGVPYIIARWWFS